MSLRLKLALAIAAVAGLVAAGIGLVAYDRERAARLDRARTSAASAVREAVKLYDSGVAVPADRDSDTILELTPTTTNSRIPASFRRVIVDNHIYTTFVRSDGVPYVLAGARRRNGGRIYVRQSFAADATALADLRVVLVQVGLAAAALGALLGVGISALLARPLRRSASLARRLASGDLDARLRPRGADEAAALGRALDEMAEALGNKLKELDDAAERERRFSSDVAHELRTPVTGMVAAAALLDDTRAARMVRERASALAALVEDLLEVMRLDSATETARPDEFDLVRLVADVVRGRAPEAELRMPPTCPVVSDPRRIERVLVNLLDNARRYGRAPIVVSVGPDASITVRDNGDGFGDFISRAGDRFALAAPERGKGTGLGLAIARGQARVLGGRLELRDEGGAVARLVLPGAARPTRATPPAPEAVPG
jgi:signal transduction histidine kinase